MMQAGPSNCVKIADRIVPSGTDHDNSLRLDAGQHFYSFSGPHIDS